jgi:aspartate aminotransferase
VSGAFGARVRRNHITSWNLWTYRRSGPYRQIMCRRIIGAMTAFSLADRMSMLGTESAFEVLARAKAMEAAGKKVIHLEIGEPDFPTAAHIIDAAVEALQAGQTHYVPAPGVPPLREAVAEFLERNDRMRVTPDRVIVTPGAKPIMFFTIMALCGPGDEVLYPDPSFPMYESITAFAGATGVPIPLREDNEFRIDTAELESLVTERSKLLIINSPHNPCGSSLTREDCEAIAEIALRHDLIVLSDEVYWAIRYGAGPHASVLDVDGMADRTILLDGWSKTWAMTGWRLGFGVFPPALVEPVTRLVINSVSCTSAFSQYAALAALQGPWAPVQAMVEEFRRRRDVIVSGLNAIPGISCLEPQGAFYVFPNITGTGLTSGDLQARLLQDAGIAALGGTAFGRYGEGFMRFSYANSVENIRLALDAVRANLAEAPAPA